MDHICTFFYHSRTWSASPDEEEKRSVWLSTSQETVEIMRQGIEQSPNASTRRRRLCREHGIPKSTVW